MPFVFRKHKTVLNFLKDKPEVYKAAQIVMPTVDEQTLVTEISEALGVPQGTTKNVIEALINRTCLMLKLGHGVRLGGMGTLLPRMRVKAAKSYDDVDASTVVQKHIRFVPGKRLKDIITNATVEEYGTISKMEIPESDEEEDNG